MDATTLKAKSKENEDIRAEVDRVRAEAQLLKMQLVSQGVQDNYVVPAGLRSGLGQAQDPGMQYLEHRMMLEWLAEVRDVTSRRCVCIKDEFQIAGRTAVIGSAVQWPLSGGLKLTLPLELEGVMAGMLSKAQRSCLSLEDLESFAAEWEMLPANLMSDDEVLPGFFFINRATSATIVVSAWPKLAPPVTAASSQPGFDAGKFFAGASHAMPHAVKVEFSGQDGKANSIVFGAELGAVHWNQEGSDSLAIQELGINFRVCNWPEYERFSLSGPFGSVDIMDPPSGPAQRELLRIITSFSLEHGLRVCHSQPPDVTEPPRPKKMHRRSASLPAFQLGPSRHSHSAASSLGPVQFSPVPEQDALDMQHEGEQLPVASKPSSVVRNPQPQSM